jgi:hypothetical protein
MDIHVLLAQLQLRELEPASRFYAKEERIVVEVAKAATVAMLTLDIEARVVCDSPSDFAKAQVMLSGTAFVKHVGGTWKAETSTLELPNGSAVVVVERPLAKVHERSV